MATHIMIKNNNRKDIKALVHGYISGNKTKQKNKTEYT